MQVVYIWRFRGGDSNICRLRLARPGPKPFRKNLWDIEFQKILDYEFQKILGHWFSKNHGPWISKISWTLIFKNSWTMNFKKMMEVCFEF
jgi:hypothetical protein